MEFSQYFPIWNSLTAQERRRISEVLEFRRVKKGTQIFDGTADCVGLIVVRSGQLRNYLLSEDGRQITISHLFAHDVSLLSAACVLPDLQFNVMMEAEKDSEFWNIPACLLRELTEQSLAVAHYASTLLSSNLTELMWLMEQIMWKSVDRRLAGFLLNESRLEGSNVLKITHEKVASHLGSAREVVTRLLHQFQRQGLVRLTRGTIEILDKKRLEELAGES